MNIEKRCLVFAGSMENLAADRMEAFAKENELTVVETIFKDKNAIDRLKYYMEREGIICILVHSIWDISSDKKVLLILMRMAQEHGISINEECRNYEPATLIWDGGDGC